MSRVFAQPMPDWTDREAVVEFAAAGAEIPRQRPRRRALDRRPHLDRTPGTPPPVQMANQMGMVFSKLDCKPRWRGAPARHRDPHARRPRPPRPVSSPSATARRSRARSLGRGLLVLEDAATAIPDAATGEVAEAMLALA